MWYMCVCMYICVCVESGYLGYYAQWNKWEKDKYWIISLICGISVTQHTSEGNKKEADSQI